MSLPLTLALLLLVVGCSPQDSGDPAAGDDPGLIHVHGVASDPEDPTALFAATHTGLFRVAGGEARRIGDGWHDLMGFTVADDGTFFASGHPDLRSEELLTDDGAPHLGLVRSTDRGATWESVSLLGEADFHALTIAGSTIIGADATSGRVLASDDGGQSWDERSERALGALAASQDDPAVLVGSTAEGLLRSTDGGREWTQVGDGGPGYVTSGPSGFTVVHADGQVAVSPDGRSWSERGTVPGPPEALNQSEDGQLVVAVTDVGLLRSDDGGSSWQTVYRAPTS